MGRYRTALPQLGGDVFLMDGGMETTLIFHEGLELPHFAAFYLLKTAEGRDTLRRYFDAYIHIAKRQGVGFILESATWRASTDWGDKLGYSHNALADANRQAIAMLDDIRHQHEDQSSKMVISGCIGPRGDGYDPRDIMSEFEAEWYHRDQIRTFADTAADMVSGLTMTNIPEAIGVTRAAQKVAMPVVISFTVETDGCLPTGDALGEAINAVDAATGDGPAYYMINCAHPTHFNHALTYGEPWLRRIRGLRANASTMSHAELDESEVLDDGCPKELGTQYQDLLRLMPWLNVMGGCCGTDHRHVDAIANACRESDVPKTRSVA